MLRIADPVKKEIAWSVRRRRVMFGAGNRYELARKIGEPIEVIWALEKGELMSHQLYDAHRILEKLRFVSEQEDRLKALVEGVCGRERQEQLRRFAEVVFGVYN